MQSVARSIYTGLQCWDYKQQKIIAKIVHYTGIYYLITLFFWWKSSVLPFNHRLMLYIALSISRHFVAIWLDKKLSYRAHLMSHWKESKSAKMKCYDFKEKTVYHFMLSLFFAFRSLLSVLYHRFLKAPLSTVFKHMFFKKLIAHKTFSGTINNDN